jgi:hypothetical protein
MNPDSIILTVSCCEWLATTLVSLGLPAGIIILMIELGRWRIGELREVPQLQDQLDLTDCPTSGLSDA